MQIDLGDAALAAGQRAVLDMEYTGAFSPDTGIYRSAAFQGGEAGAPLGVLLVTQFEAFGARHAFPSIDEPQAKVLLRPAGTVGCPVVV